MMQNKYNQRLPSKSIKTKVRNLFWNRHYRYLCQNVGSKSQFHLLINNKTWYYYNRNAKLNHQIIINSELQISHMW